jgi:adenine deaminase
MGREPADLAIRGVALFDLVTGETAETDIAVCGDTIVGTYGRYEGRREIDGTDLTAVPGFIDTHLHVESSLVTPAEFDRCVLPRGTTTAICDPHEIANVLGAEGIRWFLDCAAVTVMDLRVQLSSCVPATELETSGGRLEAADLVAFKGAAHGLGLAEFMNVPGVIHKDPGALAKLVAFADTRKDGHAPLVRGTELNAYLAAGILNDHETTTYEEGLEKIRKGMQVLIREGSVSKDLHALAPLIGPETWPFLAFCTDDRNPLDIAEEGHLDHMIRTAIGLGARPLDAYRVATWAAAKAFGLDDRGLVAPGRRADIVLVSDVAACAVETVISAGRVVGPDLFGTRPVPEPVGRHSIKLAPVTAEAFAVPAENGAADGAAAEMPVIGILPDRIITEHRTARVPVAGGRRVADPAQDILKVAVLARHGVNSNIGRGFVQGFGFTGGALASSVGHDAHNVCVVGDDDAAMAAAVNRLIALEGGFVAVAGGQVVAELPLPIAGLMSDRPFEEVEAALRPLRRAVAAMGCPLAEPFLQLAFLPLPVIPHLKITDLGLVDVDRFAVVG